MTTPGGTVYDYSQFTPGQRLEIAKTDSRVRTPADASRMMTALGNNRELFNITMNSLPPDKLQDILNHSRAPGIDPNSIPMEQRQRITADPHPAQPSDGPTMSGEQFAQRFQGGRGNFPIGMTIGEMFNPLTVPDMILRGLVGLPPRHKETNNVK